MMSPPGVVRPRQVYRRRLHYVDSSVQRSLLIAMVALEVFLVAATTWLAYWRLISLIDESMYRMSLSQGGPTLMRLAQEGFAVLGLFVVVNLIALVIAAGIWSHHENRVLRDLVGLIGKTRDLDFSGDAEPRRQHEVLTLASAWRARERARFDAVREQVAQLDAAWSAKQSAQDLRNHVARLSEILS